MIDFLHYKEFYFGVFIWFVLGAAIITFLLVIDLLRKRKQGK